MNQTFSLKIGQVDNSIPNYLLIIAVLGLVLPGVRQLFFGSQYGSLDFAYLITAFILAYYRGIKGVYATILIALLLTIITHIILILMGKPSWQHWMAMELPRMGTVFFLALSVGHFAEQMLSKHKVLQKANQELQELALTDELTKVYNHRYFHIRLQEEINRAQRQNKSLCLIMLDIDFFKQYNDNNGHLLGDELLRQMGGILKENVRLIDNVSRYGGEEFAIILPDTNVYQAVLVADRIRLAIADYPFVGREQQPEGKVTASLGIACFPEHAIDKLDLIGKADAALYRAKREKKNSVQMCLSLIDSGNKLEVISDGLNKPQG